MAAWILALTLAAQEVPDRLPELTGRVTAAVPDDPSVLLTIRPSGGTLKERPAEFLLYVTPDTKVLYREVPLAQQSPAANMVVQVWLKDGAGDKAAVVRLALEEKAFPRPAAPPPPPPPVAKPAPPPPTPAPAALPFPPKPAAAAVTVEAEEMDLRGVEARELKDASRGRAIWFSQPGGRAKKRVDLKKGVYDVQLVMQGKKGAVVVKVAGRDHRATADLPRFSVEIEKDEDYELRIEFAEAEVWVDRVVFTPEVTIDAEGFLRRWLLLAPLPADPRTALDAALIPNEAHLRPRAGEKTSGVVWRAWDSPDPVLDLNQALGRFAEDAAAYAVCRIKTDQEFRELELRMGSDDHAKLWLNGAELLRQPGPRVAVRDQSVARGVVLRKGENVLVFKLVNEKAAWSGCVRFVQKDGRPVTAARIVP